MANNPIAWFVLPSEPVFELTTLRQKIIALQQQGMDVVFVFSSRSNLQNDISLHGADVIHLCEGPLCLGLESRTSYALLQTLRDCPSNKIPDIVIFPLKDALGYFSLLGKFTCVPTLDSITIIIDASGYPNKRDIPEFLFPGYLLRRMELFCLESADLVLTDEITCIPDGLHIRSTRDAAEFYEDGITEHPLASARPDVFPFPLLTSCKSDNMPAKSEKGMVSIIIPHFNLGATLNDAVASAVDSDYENWEILIVDDESTDPGSVAALEAAGQKYPEVKIHRLKHSGLASLRNQAAHLAVGEFITFLDADDTVQPNYYSQMVQVLNRWPNAAYAGSWVHYFGDGLDETGPMFCTDLPLLLLQNSMTSFAVSRRHLFQQFPSKPAEMAAGFEDHEVWISMAEAGYYGICVPEPLCNYRMRRDSLSHSYSTSNRLILYDTMIQLHPEFFERYTRETSGLLQANGPSFIWTNPSFRHDEVIYDGTGRELALARQHLEGIESSRSYRFFYALQKLAHMGKTPGRDSSR